MGHPIFNICTRIDRREVSSSFVCWWYQDHGQAEEGVEIENERIVYLI